MRYVTILTLACLLPFVAAAQSEAKEDAAPAEATQGTGVVFEPVPGEDQLQVFIDGAHVTTYHYGEQWKKPFLWPLNAPGGVGVTRDWPMDEDTDIPKFATDHVHHKSFWSAYGDVNDSDLWGEGMTSGKQAVDSVEWESTGETGSITSVNTWRNALGAPIVEERRVYTFHAEPGPKGTLFDVQVTFDAKHGEVQFEDTKEGGIASVRMGYRLSYRYGTITNARGDVGEKEAWGRPAAWCDYSAELDEVGWRGLTIMDHPDNLRHPTSWHVRTYGLMGANPFGYSYFSEDEDNEGLVPDNGDYTLPEGEELIFNYRIYVHEGDVETAQVAEVYDAWAGEAK